MHETKLHGYLVRKKERQRRWTTCSCSTLLLLLVAAWSSEGSRSSSATTSSSSLSFSPQIVKDLINTKCGPNDGGCAVWVYEGSLYDPLDGHLIANVEGLELVRHLCDTDNNNTSSRYSNLQARHLKGDYKATILSRKLFCYTSPQQPQRLLDSIQLRSNNKAPKRRVPMNQAVALYDTAITHVCYNKHQFLLHTEFPNGKCIWANAIPFSTTSRRETFTKKSLDFSLFAKPTIHNVPEQLSETSSNHDDNENVGVVVTPKRLQLVQFGSSSSGAKSSPIGHCFGARETYSYTMPDSSTTASTTGPFPVKWTTFWNKSRHPRDSSSCPRVRYTRHGEGPPWYGPGKYCMLELQGRRVHSVADAPPLAASLAAQRVPGFLSVDGPITTNASAQRAIEWFRRDNLQLEEEPVLPLVEETGGGLRRLVYQVGKGGSAILDRIRAASTLKPLWNNCLKKEEEVYGDWCIKLGKEALLYWIESEQRPL